MIYFQIENVNIFKKIIEGLNIHFSINRNPLSEGSLGFLVRTLSNFPPHRPSFASFWDILTTVDDHLKFLGAILTAIRSRILFLSKRTYGEMAWIAILTKASVAEKAYLSFIKSHTCQYSWKNKVK